LKLPGASKDALWILIARGIRAFADGFVALLLPIYLLELGFSAIAIGSIITATLIGSALLTLYAGLIANGMSRRRMLRLASLLMVATGAGFMIATDYWPILVIAFIGTLNPTAGDVSLFLPLEHTVLTQTVEPSRRTALFARYGVVGTLVGALGALAAPIPDLSADYIGLPRLAALQIMFGVYAALGILALTIYRRLSPGIEAPLEMPQAPLRQSKKIVYGLMALFSVDSFGSGFFVQSLLALWLYQKYGLSTATAAAVFFWSGVFSAISYLLAVPISNRIGLVNTMVFTHLPSNLLMILVPFAPNLGTAIGLLLARSALSQMDVPTRNSYVMAVVTPEERPAAASLTAVPRSLATALSPILAGYLFGLSPFGWPLIIGGVLKSAYDVLLLLKFQKLRPPEEVGTKGKDR
jgi:MFS family permease